MAGFLAGGFVVSATLASLALEVGMVPCLAGETETYHKMVKYASICLVYT